MDAAEMLNVLAGFDTPTVTNAVATYPGDRDCLSLWEPHGMNWYTDERMRALYPSLGPVCGFAVTCVYGLPGKGFDGLLSFGDVLRAVSEAGGPAVLVMKQDMPERLRRKNAMLGGNMLTALRQAGAAGVMGDGPARDIEEMRPLKVPCLFTGLTSGHGPMPLEAVNVPVSVCQMDVCPGDIVHMDGNGAVRFPARYLPEVVERVQRIAERDEKRQSRLRETKDPLELARIMKEIY